MFHPLAFTKTFALVGVALLSITLVPALIPIFLKGRIKSEDENWLVRTMIEIFKPMLSWLMDRTTLVCWLFVVHPRPGLRRLDEAGPRVHARPRRGEPSWTCRRPCPRASIDRRRRDDLRVRDAVLRGFPEVWQVVGKAGRAETPTDPSPLDMIETVINLRDRELWPKRKLRFEDAVAQTRAVLAALEAKGLLSRPASAEERDGLVNEAAMAVVDPGRRDAPRPGRAAARRSSARSSAAPWSARRSTPCSAGSTRRRRAASSTAGRAGGARRRRSATTYGERLAARGRCPTT